MAYIVLASIVLPYVVMACSYGLYSYGHEGSSDCHLCPDGTTLWKNGPEKATNTKKTDCICKEGYWRPDGKRGGPCMLDRNRAGHSYIGHGGVPYA